MLSLRGQLLRYRAWTRNHLYGLNVECWLILVHWSFGRYGDDGAEAGTGDEVSFGEVAMKKQNFGNGFVNIIEV